MPSHDLIWFQYPTQTKYSSWEWQTEGITYPSRTREAEGRLSPLIRPELHDTQSPPFSRGKPTLGCGSSPLSAHTGLSLREGRAVVQKMRLWGPLCLPNVRVSGSGTGLWGWLGLQVTDRDWLSCPQVTCPRAAAGFGPRMLRPLLALALACAVSGYSVTSGRWWPVLPAAGLCDHRGHSRVSLGRRHSEGKPESAQTQANLRGLHDHQRCRAHTVVCCRSRWWLTAGLLSGPGASSPCSSFPGERLCIHDCRCLLSLWGRTVCWDRRPYPRCAKGTVS